MHILKIVSLCAVAISMSGCAYMNATYRSLAPNEKGAQMLVWHPDYSAGVGRNDRLCVQGARTATASTLNAAIEIASEGKAGLGYGEAVRALNPSNPQVTFASNAYFAICQLAINDSISPESVPDLIRYVTEKALEVDTDASEGTVMNSPAVVDAIAKVLEDNGIEVTPEIEEQIADAVEEAGEGEFPTVESD
jgi:hypothetical protein